MSTGAQIAAARLMGADLAYIGTRFMATAESLAVPRQRQMILDAKAADIVYTPAVSGIPGNFLRASLVAAGRDPDDPTPPAQFDFGTTEARAWRDLWAAGQGVGSIDDQPPVADLCRRLEAEYKQAAAADLTADLARTMSDPVI
jgi:nitronate monooxygenase